MKSYRNVLSKQNNEMSPSNEWQGGQNKDGTQKLLEY